MAFDAFKCTASSFPPLLSTDETCVSSIDQTQKLAICLTSIAAFTVDVNASTDIDEQAAWTAKITAGLRMTPLISNLTITPGDYQEEANENNLNGIPQYLGNSFTVVEGMFKNTPPALITKLEQLAALTSKTAGYTTVKGYFLGRNSRVTAKSTGDGFPLYNFVIKDVATEGRNKENVWAFRFYLAEDWSKEMTTFDAAFDPIALANPAV